MPPIRCTRKLAFSLSRTHINLIRRTLNANLSKSQHTFSITRRSNLSSIDSQLLDCIAYGNSQVARQLLDEMSQRENQSPVVTWTSLLSKLSKEGLIDEALALFNIIPEKNVVTCNAMLSGFVQSGRLNDACRFFEEMPVRNVVSWTSVLCGLMNCGRVEEGKRLFQVMPKRNTVTWNAMIAGLVKNGVLEGARSTFDAMPIRDLVSWNSMIGGYAENCMLEEARALFDQMKYKNVVTWTTMVAGYCRAGELGNAYELFVRMPVKNVVSWTAMIGGLSWNGYYEDAILLFLEMRKTSDVKPNESTFHSLAYACAEVGFPDLGMQLHAHLITTDYEYHDYDGRLSNSLVYMYSKFGLMECARSIFWKNSRNWTTQSCNAMINGYVKIGQLDRARNIFDIMNVPDKISWTSMITGYFNVSQVAKACEMFYNMPEKDAIACTTMISGYVQHEFFLEAMYLFSEMQMEGVIPLQATYSILLGAAGTMAYLDQGRQLHCLLMKTQTALDLILKNSLIAFYAKCGQVSDAYRVFSGMAYRDLISWNSMIMGYSQHGLAHEALSLFGSMTKSSLKPNSITFLGILSACSHAGLINEGRVIYGAMSEIYGIQPDIEHYICMINLLGRAGKVGEAEQFVLSLPSEQGVAVWGALLGICGLSEGNSEITNRTSHRLLELDPLNTPAHVVLCNMHKTVGQYGEEGMLRKEMRSKGMRKVPGCSWISMGERIHVFFFRR